MPRISDFLGQVSDADATDSPAGSSVSQNNVSTLVQGKLQVRGGIQPATFTSTSTISSSNFHTFQRLCFCKTRQGDLIGVNGIDRGFRWDGITSNVEQLGITAPSAGPSIATPSISAAGKGGAITGIANSGGKYEITSNGHDMSNGERVRIGNVTATGGMANALNAQTFTIEGVTTNTFTLTNTSFDGTYTSGGTWCEDGFGATAGTYVCGVRYTDDTTTPVPSSMSVLTTVTAEETDQFDWSSIATTTEARVSGTGKVELWRSTAGVTNVLFKVHTVDYSGSITFNDQVDDNTLNLSSDDDTILVLANPPVDNSLVARRFEPPPNDRPVVVQFQDRYFYLGNVDYNRGTVATNGSTTITGTSTDWVATMVGRYIEISGEAKPFKITAASATSITVDTAVSNTASGLSYVIRPEQSNRRQVDFSEPDEPESVSSVNVFTVQEYINDDDDIVGACPLGPYLYLCGRRHKYAFSFSVDPLRDGSVRYVDDRGIFNHYCWDVFENAAYMMDDSGPYIFGGSSQSIGTAIHDLWRRDGDGDKIDFAKSDKFHVKVDRSKARVYFFVAFEGDAGSFPRRALVFNIRRKTWDLFEYPQQIPTSSSVQISGENRLSFGGENSKVYLADQGTTDVVTSETAGTATGGSSNTLSDSAASFTSGMVGASVYIFDGTGKGQRRTISGQTSTTLTVSANWTTNPDTTSKYVVGAIPFSWRSSSFHFPMDDAEHKRSVGIKFKPTAGDQRVDIRIYYNNSTTPASNGMPMKLGDAIEVGDTNTEDAVLYMKSARSSLENASGHEMYRIDGMYSGTSHGDHKMSVELRGYAGDNVPEIQTVDIEGVAE